MKQYYIILCALFCYGQLNAQQLELTVDGNIDFSGNYSIPTEAGEDYSQSLEGTQEIYLSIDDKDFFGKKVNNVKWIISIELNEELGGDAVLEAKRTGNGSNSNSPGKPNIKGGDTYRPVTDVKTRFFHGKREIINIPISFRLTGMSVLAGENLSSHTEVIFTISEGW